MHALRRAFALAVPLVVCAACGSARPTPRAAPPSALTAAAPAPRDDVVAPDAVDASAPPDPARAAARAFDALARGYFAERFRYNPSEATSTGVHAHDDGLEDYARPAVARYVAWLTDVRDQLARMLPSLPASADPSEPDGSDHPRLDASILRDAIELELLELTRWDALADDPGRFHTVAATGVYELMTRAFAPVDVRVRSATARLAAVPAMLQGGEAWLAHPPRLAVEVALRELAGSIAMVRDVFPVFADQCTDPEARAAAHRAAREATAALERHRTFLRATLLPRATGDYHDGRERWTTRARLRDGVRETPEQLRDAALAEVRRLQAELRTLAQRIARPRETLAATLARILRDHPAPAALLDAYRARQDALRAFVRERRLIAIDPARDDLAIAETPAFLRATTVASLSAPGALEANDTRTFFYVTPADLTRPPREVSAYLSEHAVPAIVVTSIHEAYPGHHVQGIHQRRARSLVRQVLWQGTYGEGWAHYVEQLMVDEGYGDDAVRLEQSREALMRAARAYLDVGVHVFGLDYDDAVRFYRDEAHLAQPVAEMEARRVCLDPASVYVYTYGKAALFRLRRAVVDAGPRLSLSAFHDALTDFGSAPLPELARVLWNVDLGPWAPGEVLSAPRPR